MLSDGQTVSADKQRVWKVVLIIVIVAIVAMVAFRLISQATSDEKRGLALQELPKLVPAESKDLSTLVLANYHEYRTNSILWSFAYFGCLFGSAFASASAGVVLKLDMLKDRPALKNDSAAALAAIAALLVTLSTSGDFQRKWQSNRIAADAMENLSYDLLRADKALSHDLILDRIKTINEARSEGVVGRKAGGKGGGEAETGSPTDKGSSQKPTSTPESKPAENSKSGTT
ncbi:MAG TPA: hypothetical protein VGP73_13835 [Thermoanaerobaculia bacterium]